MSKLVLNKAQHDQHIDDLNRRATIMALPVPERLKSLTLHYMLAVDRLFNARVSSNEIAVYPNGRYARKMLANGIVVVWLTSLSIANALNIDLGEMVDREVFESQKGDVYNMTSIDIVYDTVISDLVFGISKMAQQAESFSMELDEHTKHDYGSNLAMVVNTLFRLIHEIGIDLVDEVSWFQVRRKD